MSLHDFEIKALPGTTPGDPFDELLANPAALQFYLAYQEFDKASSHPQFKEDCPVFCQTCLNVVRDLQGMDVVRDPRDISMDEIRLLLTAFTRHGLGYTEDFIRQVMPGIMGECIIFRPRA